MKSTLSYFNWSFVFTILAVGAGYYFGGMPGLYAVLMLGLLETSLSIDNAVVNAKQLNKMTPFWRKMFLTVGMVIAVFGMRIVFPILIVAITTGMGMWDVSVMAMNDPAKYAATLTATHSMIAGFGGAFLMLVFLKFFLDAEKDTHWVAMIEKPLAKIGNAESIQIVITMAILYIVSKYIAIPAEAISFLMAGGAGIITYVLVDSLELFTGNEEEEVVTNGTAVMVAKNGLMGFLYLEVLDASFSFDGVIGAFAVTNNLLVIALGLGVGAMFVRSMTLYLVDKGTLAEFRYLEHGAFYAIGALATIMFISTFHHMSELVSGTIGAAFIVVALISSIMHNRKDRAVIKPPYEPVTNEY
jgi:hypothetical protein